MEQVIWFDLEVTDGIINPDIKRKAIGIFNFWKKEGIYLIGEQKISKWRPSKNIALITNVKDLYGLYNEINEGDTAEAKFTNNTLLFETKSVLRFSFEK